MVWVLVEMGISPHLVTVFFVLPPGLAAAYLTWNTPSYWELVLAGVLWQMAAILDRCDGEIARVKLAESRFGAWFDTVTDNLAYFCVVAAILSGTHRLHPQDSLYTYVSVAAVVSLILSTLVAQPKRVRLARGYPKRRSTALQVSRSLPHIDRLPHT